MPEYSLTEEDIEVVYVKAHARKLKGLIYDTRDSDLRSCWYPYDGRPAPPDWKEDAYYISNATFVHPNGTVLPPNTAFVVTELAEGKLFAESEPNEEGLPCFGGDYLELTCLHPDTEERMVCGFWHGVQEDQSKNFDLVENPLALLAIAGTGL